MEVLDAPLSTLDRGPGRQVLSTGHRALRCPLTDEEHRAKGQELARLLVEQSSLKAEHKGRVALMKAEAEEVQGRVHDCREDVRLQSEVRSVEVEHVADFGRGVVECFRLDTGDLVSSRPLTPDERQLELGS